MSKPNTLTYNTRTWPTYNKALKRWGSLTIWFDPDTAWAAKPTGKRGRQPVYPVPEATPKRKSKLPLRRCGRPFLPMRSRRKPQPKGASSPTRFAMDSQSSAP